MHFLILGYSRIVQKRVLPALLQLPSVSKIDIASQKNLTSDHNILKSRGTVFNNYGVALRKSKANIVYISLVNNAHDEWAEQAISMGYHVIIDKPAFTSLKNAEKAVDLSEKKGCCLAEAVVYEYHPQIKIIKEIFSSSHCTPTRINTIFSFPSLSPGDFRYNKSLGGGSLYDLGPYAVSVCRIFMGNKCEEVSACVLSHSSEDGVDTGFSLLATFSGGRSVVGHFGFNSEYKNFASLLSPQLLVEIDRIFTTTADFENSVYVKSNGISKTIKIPKADAFLCFLDRVTENIKHNNYQDIKQNLLSDARFLDRLRRSTKVRG